MIFSARINRIQKGTILICLSGVAAIVTLLLPPIPQSTAYHLFADSRSIMHIPNFWNVVTNLPFLAVGVSGLALAFGVKASGWLPRIYVILFLGVVLTSFGSGYYHWSPNNDTLIWDRLPMTIVFMALLSIVIAQFISYRLGCILFLPLLTIGIVSIWWWHHTEALAKGDLRLYGLVQFYPAVFIPLIVLLYYTPTQKSSLRPFYWIVFWYFLAKAFEFLDVPIYGHFPLSGHSLKHLAAAVSTFYFIRLFQAEYSKQNTHSANARK